MPLCPLSRAVKTEVKTEVKTVGYVVAEEGLEPPTRGWRTQRIGIRLFVPLFG